MNKLIIKFDVSSPEQLHDALVAHQLNEAHFASVRVFGPQVLTRQFHFPNSSEADLILGLKQEASETLSIPAQEIAIIYKITSKDEQNTHGVFSAISRRILLDYLDCFKDHPLIPVSLITSAVGTVNDFLKENPLPGENYCLVNFLRPHAVNVIVFSDSKPIFFRELYDLSENDFEHKITDTIRYSCSRSTNKKIDHIFFTGDLTGKETLMNNLKTMQSPISQEDPFHTPGRQVDISDLNLFHKYVLNLGQRQKLFSIFSLISTGSLLLTVLLFWNFTNSYRTLHEVKNKVNMNDYDRALNLQNKIRLMNAK